MKIKKLFTKCGTPYHNVVQLCNGSFAKFFAIPARKISDRDLTQIPYYPNAGKKASEAEEYMYSLYGLEK